MPHSVLRRVPAVALSGALALATLTATAPGASASPSAPQKTVGVTALKVLTYNTFLISPGPPA
ncbi:hypothetical protein P3L51_01885 [Streptomyces sp. PSRA5]|uniref:hypothetical protein n=1 Tax=Streptomyces panacea TaxID=3035064 RepID=UPI00339C1C43